MLNNKITLFIVMILLLQGCAKTEKPPYPADLQLIIATQNTQTGEDSDGAISVSQLMQSVRTGEPSDKVNDASSNQWVFNAQKTDLSKQKRKLHLNYQGNAMLPNDHQMAMVRELILQSDMVLESIAIGSCANKTPLACVSNAQKRAVLLVEKIGAGQPKIEYKPKLGHDVAVVTFARRSS